MTDRARGFSLLELIVVMAILAILWSITAPAVQNARAAARRTLCLTHLRELGIAAQNFSHKDGNLPSLFTMEQVINWGTVKEPLYGPSPWTVQLLRYIEQTPLAERLTDAANDPSVPAGTDLASLGSMQIPIFLCPDDPNDGIPGNLTYAINTGYIGDAWYGQDTIFTVADPCRSPYRPGGPWTKHSSVTYSYRFLGTVEEQHEVTRATGVAWPDRKISLNHISGGDGMTNTLLFAENLQSQRWVGRAPIVVAKRKKTAAKESPECLVDLEYSDFAFGIPVAINPGSVNEQPFDPYVGEVIDREESPTAGVCVRGGDKSHSLALNGSFTGSLTGTVRDGRINWNQKTAPEGQAPRPSSAHSGGVNVVFVGGNGKFLSQQISTLVYAHLVTWDGSRKLQSIITGAEF
jgi:prepilin-type N-terminal cleavage/methylation domain-containing protein